MAEELEEVGVIEDEVTETDIKEEVVVRIHVESVPGEVQVVPLIIAVEG